MSISNFSNTKINYIYLECPKKEYYFVSNLTDSHEYEYIKPIGEFLVEFLNADLEGYQEGLKCLHDLVYELEKNIFNGNVSLQLRVVHLSQ